MKKEIFFLLLMSLFNLSIGSIQTLDVSKIQTSIPSGISSTKSNSLIQEEKALTKKNNSLSPEEKQWNFFMRTGLIILGTFIFLFVLFLVFRMKKK